MLISFEGIDGSGKSTQASKLRDFLLSEGLKAELLREPGGTQVGERIRHLLFEEEMHPITELLLFEAARSELVRRKIKPLLSEGKVVILDRFVDSTLAYQGYGRGLELSLVRELNGIATDGLVPHLTFLIDTDVRTALSRKQDKNRFEDLNFILKVREGFLKIAEQERERIFLINGNLPPSAVFKEIKKIVQEKLWDLKKH